MRPTAFPRLLLRLALPAACLLAGCGHAYVNPDIADPARAKERLAADSAICKQEANDTVQPTYGLERFEFDPTIEAQADRFVANAAEDDANLDVYATCMRHRGWRFKK
jgi:hypothetical protein